MVYLKYLPLKDFVKGACFESIIGHLLTLAERGENKTSWIWFTMMYVASIYIP
jgi:hypothetical protein